METLYVILQVLFTQVYVTRCAPQAAAADGRRSLFTEPVKTTPGPEKNFTGIKITQDSKQIIYYHEQTIAVVEVDPQWQLLNCELLEVRTKSDRDAALNSLKPFKKTKISFWDMSDLLSKCEKLPGPVTSNMVYAEPVQQPVTAISYSTILQGIFPGTKWCGRGDLAETYFDLGDESDMDRCCRTHDLCPVKVAGFKTQYNITNYSMVTKLHCLCDETFFKCLKMLKTGLADFMGTLYFNLGNPECLDEVTIEENNKKKVIKKLTPNKLRY